MGPVVWRVGDGRGGNMNNGWKVGYLEVIIPPGKVVSQDEEERIYKP